MVGTQLCFCLNCHFHLGSFSRQRTTVTGGASFMPLGRSCVVGVNLQVNEKVVNCRCLIRHRMELAVMAAAVWYRLFQNSKFVWEVIRFTRLAFKRVLVCQHNQY